MNILPFLYMRFFNPYKNNKVSIMNSEGIPPNNNGKHLLDTTIANLPSDVVMEIFARLPGNKGDNFKQFNQTLLVSKRWKELTVKAMVQWTDKHPNIPLYNLGLKSYKILLKFCKTIPIRSLNLQYHSNLNNSRIQELIDNCPNLKFLSVKSNHLVLEGSTFDTNYLWPSLRKKHIQLFPGMVLGKVKGKTKIYLNFTVFWKIDLPLCWESGNERYNGNIFTLNNGTLRYNGNIVTMNNGNGTLSINVPFKLKRVSNFENLQLQM